MAVRKAPAAGTKHLESPQQHGASSTAVLGALELRAFPAGTYRLWGTELLWLSISGILLVCKSSPKPHCSFPKYKVARPNSTFRRRGGFVSSEQQCQVHFRWNSSCKEEICRAHLSPAGFSLWVPVWSAAPLRTSRHLLSQWHQKNFFSQVSRLPAKQQLSELCGSFCSKEKLAMGGWYSCVCPRDTALECLVWH